MEQVNFGGQVVTGKSVQFGVPLESLIERDAVEVPIVVQKVIEAVE